VNDEAFAAIAELRERAQRIASLELDHFVFPKCENGHLDATKPQKSWRTAWRQLTKAIECPQCGRLQRPGKECINKICKADIENVKSPTAGLRFHDLRHHAITELAESQTSDQTIMAIAGHVSPKMLAHYSHVRLEAKRKALDTLSRIGANAPSQETGSGKQGGMSGHVTKSKSEESVPLEVIENDGRPEWIRTIDLFRVKAHLSSPPNNLRHRQGPPKALQGSGRRKFDGLKNGSGQRIHSF
jgi:Phage integrase family